MKNVARKHWRHIEVRRTEQAGDGRDHQEHRYCAPAGYITKTGNQISKENSPLLHRTFRLVLARERALEFHHSHREHYEGERNSIRDETPGYTEQFETDAGGHWPEHPCQLELRRIQSNSIGEILVTHQVEN